MGQGKEALRMAFRTYTVIYEAAEEGGFYAHIPTLDITTEGETLDGVDRRRVCPEALKCRPPRPGALESME